MLRLIAVGRTLFPRKPGWREALAEGPRQSPARRSRSQRSEDLSAVRQAGIPVGLPGRRTQTGRTPKSGGASRRLRPRASVLDCGDRACAVTALAAQLHEAGELRHRDPLADRKRRLPFLPPSPHSKIIAGFFAVSSCLWAARRQALFRGKKS